MLTSRPTLIHSTEQVPWLTGTDEYHEQLLPGVLFDWWDQTGVVSLLVVPEFIWEAFLCIYCAVCGFRRDSPILSPERSS